MPSSALHLVLCICGVWISWSAHDVLQEKVFRVPGFTFGFFMAFTLQTVSFVLSAAQTLAQRLCAYLRDDTPPEQFELSEARRRADEEKAEAAAGEGLLAASDDDDDDGEPSAMRHPPASAQLVPASCSTFLWYIALSALLAAANGCASAALVYVSMPVKVLFKSCKIISVMAMGSCFGRLYACAEYTYMLLVVEGLAAFFLASSSTGHLRSSALGAALLSAAVLADSLVPNVQQRLLTHRPKSELIFHTNWVSAALSAAYMLATGEFGRALGFLRHRPRCASLLLLQSMCGYAGIAFYMESVRSFGSKGTTVITSCRKVRARPPPAPPRPATSLRSGTRRRLRSSPSASPPSSSPTRSTASTPPASPPSSPA